MNQTIKLIGAVTAVFISAIAATKINFSGDQSKLDRIKVREGFKIEHLHSPSDAKQGSWVSLTFDPKGRLITSDQFGSLYRMTVAPIGSSNLSSKIEKLEIEGDTLGLGTAQGLLWAFDGLYMMVNNRPNAKFARKSGLYKLEDTDGNDQFDKVTLMKELAGDGEHGPHSVILSPDGQSLYVIAGNHTDAPNMDSYLLPNTWQHDNLFPFIKDPRGHATDRKEPGGWIAKVDPKTNHWEFVSGGYRNPYDLAFNEAGDLFVYDSDMEWEFGVPWYRPTRICHVTSGSEFGWRTASGKWPVTFADNLSPVINIGQGSPTNLVSLKNAAFPEDYKNSLLAFDWSFGIVHTLHLKPKGSTYTAEREEFLSGVPLPLTDGIIGPDGALYFLTGGRRLESDLYRVSYSGNIPKTETAVQLTEENKMRRMLETFHSGEHPEAVEKAWTFLDHPDRFVRYAARIAIEHQPVTTWSEKSLKEENPTKSMFALMALIRTDTSASKSEIFKVLHKISYDNLSASDKLDLMRVYELLFARTGKPEVAHKAQFIARYMPKFPTKDDEINRQMAKLLIYLETPGIATKVMNLIEEKSAIDSERVGGEVAVSEEELILRNPAYGLDIAKMLEKLPPARQTYYAILLAPLKTGWTPALQEKYFTWYRNALKYQGGLSYIGFIDRARKIALANVPKAQFARFDKLSGGDLLSSSGNDLTDITYPKGPGKSWKTNEAAALFTDELTGRSFTQGKNMYMATLCNRCHSMRGEGSNVGPDLTQLATRFSAKDILEAIIEPNVAISDQYAATQFQMKNGETIVGKIINEDNDNFFVSQNPFTPDLSVKVLKRNVVSRKYSPVSMMLPGLINSLNDEELKDLMAYLIAGGNENHKVFK
jgi:putative heme-binding domain-containing protein